MTIEKKIQVIVENNIPLDPSCEKKRKEQMQQRISIRLQIEELIREISTHIQHDPRDRIK